MPYLAKTAAAKEVDNVLSEKLNSSHLQWTTYATQLGRCYTRAYEEHEKTLTDVGEKYRLAAESAYWVLSLFCVAFAGGIAGGLMAPWVNGVGKVIATNTFKSTINHFAKTAIS